jgi:hypothetical protein
MTARDATDSGLHGRAEGAWLAAIDVTEALKPTAVIAGHKNPQTSDNPSQLQATRLYLGHGRDLSLVRHLDRLNPGALWGAAMTLLPEN